MKMPTDSVQFRAMFNAFITASRGVTNYLQKEGKGIKGFGKWYGVKQQEMRNDELLRFFHEARIDDFHRGQQKLKFQGARIEFFSRKQAEPRPPLGASLVGGPEGLFWLVDEGTPKERRVPIRGGVKETLQVEIADAPSTHRGKQLTRRDPITLCELAFDYLQGLLSDAKSDLSSCRKDIDGDNTTS